jgi:hypothetical protein
MYRNPLDPKLPSHKDMKRLDYSTLEPVEGVYLTDDWYVAANFAMGQSIANYASTFGDNTRTSIPGTHPMLQLSYPKLDQLLQKHGFKNHEKWDDDRYDYSEWGVLLPVVLELDVGGLPLYQDPEVELVLNFSYDRFRKRSKQVFREWSRKSKIRDLKKRWEMIQTAPYTDDDWRDFKDEADYSKEMLTYQLVPASERYAMARELSIKRVDLGRESQSREIGSTVLDTLGPQFKNPLKALESALGEAFAKDWYTKSEFDTTPLPDSFIESAGLFYTTSQIQVNRVTAISGVVLPGGIPESPAYQDGPYWTPYPELLYSGDSSDKMLFHGTTLIAVMQAFPELLDRVPQELKEHWYEIQLKQQIDEDLSFDFDKFFGAFGV